jgi:hypothetical protein
MEHLRVNPSQVEGFSIKRLALFALRIYQRHWSLRGIVPTRIQFISSHEQNALSGASKVNFRLYVVPSFEDFFSQPYFFDPGESSLHLWPKDEFKHISFINYILVPSSGQGISSP